MKSLFKEQNRPYKVLWFGDLVAPSGFGRIGIEVGKRLSQRGYQVQGAAINYTGWPHSLPLQWVWPLGERDIFGGLVNVVNQFQPDLIISCQDFPYHQTIWNACKIDFSRVKWVWITPIDGVPVHPDWLQLVDFADGCMVISRFGVEAVRQAGKRVNLCHPGVDTTEFYPAETEEKNKFRAMMGYSPEDFIIGSMCMNQGRKAISKMVEGFFDFAVDKSNARLYLDMDKVSPAGWDIPALLKQMKLSEDDQKRVKYREDAFKASEEVMKATPDLPPTMTLLPLRNRYVMLDLHIVLSHREGFGLPLLESQACHIPAMALDWCSGTEICGDGKGYLIPKIDYMEYGTWGGAKDAFPNMTQVGTALGRAYYDSIDRAAISQRGYEWAITNTWDKATDAVEEVIQIALNRSRKDRPQHHDTPTVPTSGLSDTHSLTYNPSIEHAYHSAAPAIGDNPVLPESGGAHQMPEIGSGDGDRSGEAGTA